MNSTRRACRAQLVLLSSRSASRQKGFAQIKRPARPQADPSDHVQLSSPSQSRHEPEHFLQSKCWPQFVTSWTKPVAFQLSGLVCLTAPPLFFLLLDNPAFHCQSFNFFIPLSQSLFSSQFTLLSDS